MIQILCNNLRVISNIGTMKTATADFAGSIFLGSAFYSFTPFLIRSLYIDMNFCNFIDLFPMYIFM